MADSTQSITDLFAALWRDYVTIAPQAARVHELLSGRGETIVNDHIALRTFGTAEVGMDVLARPFVDAGYERKGRYRFAGKKLRARHYEHPEPSLPNVFISELEVESLSAALQTAVHQLIAAMPAGAADGRDLVAAGRLWPVSHATYRALLQESEYAAWMAAFGFRANHFTVDVGALKTFADLQGLNEFLLANGFALNDSGGLIKGSPDEFLEQSSTRADAVEVAFTDGPALVPSCYYEFARRYVQPNGELFRGFVTGSADKLFESTDVKR